MNILGQLFFSRVLCFFFVLLVCSCSNKKKEHKIPFEQTPIALSEDADANLVNEVNSFKAGYSPEHLKFFSMVLLQNEMKKVSSVNLADDDLELMNQKHLRLFKASDSMVLNSEFSKVLTKSDVSEFKVAFEDYLVGRQVPEKSALTYDGKSKNIFDLLFEKKLNRFTFAKALSVLLARVHVREVLRSLRLAILVTEEGLYLGYVINDPEQGQLLFALSNSDLGKQLVFFGPTASLAGNIAVLDFEAYLLLTGLGKYNTRYEEARSFLIDQSAKKFGLKTHKLKLSFQSDSVDVLALSTQVESEVESRELVSAVLRFESKYSEQSDEHLKKSYLQYESRIKREQDARNLQEEMQRLGSQYSLVGPWPHKFGGRENMKASLQRSLGDNKLTTSPKLVTFKRSRECFESDEDSVIPADSNFLREWGLLGHNLAWTFEDLTVDSLALCRSRSHIGTSIKEHTRILQPIFVYLPKNPENLSAADFREKAAIIQQEQQKLMDSASSKFCSEIRMKSADVEFGVGRTPLLDKLWIELFHKSSDIVLPQEFSDHNEFVLQCVFAPIRQ